MTTHPLHQVPVTVIGGFLGSGKTTLLNQVLTRTTGVRYAVMVNDFGELAIDESLIKQHDGDTISFANGCVCCSLGDNLLQSIDQLLQRTPAPEHFLVEVSGVANPKAIADVATLHLHLRRDLIITLADAATLLERKQDSRLNDTLDMQLAPADLIVLNKCDLTTDAELNEVSAYLQANYKSALLRTTQAEIPPEVLSQHELALDTDTSSESTAAKHSGNWQSRDWHHDPEADFYRSTVTLPETMTPDDLCAILKQHLSILLRAKGFVKGPAGKAAGESSGNEYWCSVQLSGKQLDVQPLRDSAAPERPVLVIIGLQPLHEVTRAIKGECG